MSLNLLLKVWRQRGPKDDGHFETYSPNDINEDMSFLEMLDVVNEELIAQGKKVRRREHIDSGDATIPRATQRALAARLLPVLEAGGVAALGVRGLRRLAAAGAEVAG